MGELRVAIPDEEPDGVEVTVHGEIAGLLSDPTASWMSGDAHDVNPSSAVLDEEEDIEGAHPGGLDSEEVATQDRVCLGAQERLPRQTPPRRGIEASGAEDGCDRRR